jgi:hypothetical protein
MLSKLRRKLMPGRPERDPEVVERVHEAAMQVRENSRLLREIRAVQGELQARPNEKGKGPWTSTSPNTRS